MPYDPYCRYPSSCCSQPLCGVRCCSSAHGTPCGTICAPKNSLVCCDPSTSKTCPVGKTCCGQNCCDAGSTCCGGKCCGSGQVCTNNNQCCDRSSYCNGLCCTSGSTCQSNGICCPSGSTGCGSNSCCNSSQTCSLGHCCPAGSAWCSAAGKCCPSGTRCLGGTCCASKNQCGSACCTTGQTCDSNVCTNCPPKQQCAGNVCCPDGQQCSINGTCQVPCQIPCGKTGQECCSTGELCSLNHCCPVGNSWCGAGNGSCCRNNNQRCSGTGCCNSKQYCFGQCCNSGQYCDGNMCTTCPSSKTQCGTSCCDAGEVCCGDFCCSLGQICNSVTKQCETPICKVPCGNGQCCKDNEKCCAGSGTCCSKDWECCERFGTTYCCDHCSSFGDFCAYCSFGSCKCKCSGASEQSTDKYSAKRNNVQLESDAKLQIPVQPQKDPEDLPNPAAAVISPSAFPCYTSQTLFTDACAIFPCLNNVSNCGPGSYLMEMYDVYCTNVHLYQSQFNAAGKQFLTCAAGCIAKSHYDAYGQGVIPCCNSVERWGSGDQQKTCFTKTCDYCDSYLTNTFAFTELFNNTAIVPFEIYFQYCNVGESKN